MKLDRNIPRNGGKGKYALVLMRNYPKPYAPELNEVQHALRCLERNGMMDYGEAGSPSEFFLIRLKDRFAGDALRAYADAAKRYADKFASDDVGLFQSMVAWACEVLRLAGRAGELSEHCKTPD
jgi:hypothetical protein